MSRLQKPNKKAVVCHSGGMDSSICLKLAVEEFGADCVISVGFSFGQRHSNELTQAAKICSEWGVDRVVLDITCLTQITHNALMDTATPIAGGEGAPNTLVVGRNGLMARLCAIHAQDLGAHCVYMGVMELEEANSGYRDCSRAYMDKMEDILRIDLADPSFQIRTPLVGMTKAETMALADEHGVLDYLLEETITCYEGIPKEGCGVCPACKLRNAGIRDYRARV